MNNAKTDPAILAQKALLADLVQYQSNSIISRIMLKQEKGNITLFAFDQDQNLSEHTAPFDAFIIVVEGEGEIIIDGKSNFLKTGESIVMPANIPHAVKAKEQFKMLLVMIKA